MRAGAQIACANPLMRFWMEFLADRHAVVEPAPDGSETLATLLDSDLARQLGTSEDPQLVFDARREGVFAGLGSDLLDKALAVTEATIPIGYGVIDDIHLRGKHLDRDLARDFTFTRCSPGALDPVSILIPVSRIGFRLSMVGDETRERLLTMDILETSRRILPAGRGLPDDIDPVPLPEDDPRRSEFLPAKDLLTAIEASAIERAEAEARAFQQTLQHRLALDLARLEDYYSELIRALESDRRRQTLTPQEQAAKRKAIEEDFHRQVEDVRQRAALRAELRPFALQRLLVPACRVRVMMRIGTHRRPTDFLWTPFERRFEPYACPGCSQFTTHLEGTRDGRLLCPTCAA
ncbi:MAG: hypothetical protein OZSIB_3715 [Candidatus Ozemobacter sibiricus]|jgi:hypothetical protein|uniref:Uncharacterized protein n=1 Tax=Candidatus Ozemobacter sibiricus TaxID=2268124 RepID=A0A367ZEF1_9BACT|nr:MAG: hypothetical protein OZSIB_3715 [Candidatus Ozemobacter sibiricus]